MNSQAMILVGLGIALLLVASGFSLGSGLIKMGEDAVNNLSEKAESGDITGRQPDTEDAAIENSKSILNNPGKYSI